MHCIRFLFPCFLFLFAFAKNANNVNDASTVDNSNNSNNSNSLNNPNTLNNSTNATTPSMSMPMSYSNYWPDLETQCTSALHVFISLNVSVPSFDPKLCCFNATTNNPIGNFPMYGVESTGSFVGCSLDSVGRPFVSAMYNF